MGKRHWIIATAAAALLAWGAAPARAATIDLYDWAFNIDGTLYLPPDNDSDGYTDSYSPPNTGDLPSYIDVSGFQFSDFSDLNNLIHGGLGTISVTMTGEGPHYVGLFVDHKIDEAVNTYYNESGAEVGSPAAGQTWEIDEPGYGAEYTRTAGGQSVSGEYYGDIFNNLADSDLDNKIFFGCLDDSDDGDCDLWDYFPDTDDPISDDVSMALAWDFFLDPGEYAIVRFDIGLDQPTSGFYLTQTDPGSDVTLYYSSTLQVVPEPGTLILVGSGLAGLAGWRRRRAKG